METNSLFSLALGLRTPWRVIGTAFSADRSSLTLSVDFDRGARWECPECGARGCKVHDAAERTWRHLDFFQHQAFITAPVPRVRCDTCGVKTVVVPWARAGSGFTLLMEAMIIELCRCMPVLSCARMLAVEDKRIWRVLDYYVSDARTRFDASDIKHVGVDETSARKRHDYITVFCDLDERRIVHIADGKDAKTVGEFTQFLHDHGGSPEHITEVSSDMSPAFIAGVREELPNAHITFDRFHISKIINDAIDNIRRSEAKKDKTIKGARYAFLKSPETCTAHDTQILQPILARNAALAEAYRLRETFRDFYQQPNEIAAHGFLKAWYHAAQRSALKPLQKAANTIRKHWKGILRWHHTHINNGIMEGLNSLLQAAKRKARGYRTHKNFKTVAYLVAGKLDIKIGLTGTHPH